MLRTVVPIGGATCDVEAIEADHGDGLLRIYIAGPAAQEQLTVVKTLTADPAYLVVGGHAAILSEPGSVRAT